MAGLIDTTLNVNLPTAPVMPAAGPAPTTMNADADQTLLAVLKRIGDLQAKPLVPDNPLAQLGAALSGFAAGVQGRPNPVLEQYRQDRALQVAALQHQAQIAGTLATIDNQRQTREQARQRLLFDMNKEATDTKEKERSFAFNVGEKLAQSDNVEEREQGYRMLQRVVDPATGQPIIDTNIDPKRLALMRGKDYATKWDRGIDTMIALGDLPPSLATEYPPDVFPVAQWRQALAQGGAPALSALKKGTAPTESALKAEYTALASLPKEARTPEQVRRMEAIKEGLTLSAGGQNTVLAMAKALREKDARLSLPQKDDADYIADAVKMTDRSESFEKDLDDEAKRLGLTGAALFKWKDEKRVAYQRQIAEVKAGAQPVSPEWGNQIAVLRDTKDAVVQLMTRFSPDERRQFAGWFNYNKSQVEQLIRANPRFAEFKALLGRVQTYAFSLGGKQLTEGERDIVFLGIPTGKEISPTDFEVKLKEAYGSIDRITEDKITLATSPRDFIKRMPKIEGPGVSPTGGRKWKQVSPGVWAEE